VLVNNAANDQRYEFDQITPEQFDHTIAVNFRHVFFAAQAIVHDVRFGSVERAVCFVSEAGPAIGEPRLEHDISWRRDRLTHHVAGQCWSDAETAPPAY
jgi:NAD(P)-dependent dehydrogenase (short-subunit alcohol dehydrogenase family)